MKQIFSWLKSSLLGKIFTTALVSMLLFVSAACSSVQAKTADQVREEVPSGAVTSEYRGGMNSYSDVDPRHNTSYTKAKAKALIDNAEREVIDQTDDIGTNTKRILNKKSDNLDEFNRNVKGSAEATTEKAKSSAKDFVQGTKKGTENIQENTRNATKDAYRGVDKASDNVKGNTQKAGKDFINNLNETGKNIRGTLDKATDALD